MGFSRQEYWNGLLFPSPRDLPNPGIEPGLLHCRQILNRLSHWVTQVGNLYFFFLIKKMFFGCVTHGILAPQPGMEPVLLA